MLSKAQIKYIRSLTQQKYRKEHNVFVAEGDKIATEWLQYGHDIRMIVALEDWLARHLDLISLHPEASVISVSQQELDTVSQLQTPNKALLVVQMPEKSNDLPLNEWTIVLDGIQDPGNMGTIIRTADWFGIRHIVCSPAAVNVYNPKVIQAAMGSHLRVTCYETELDTYISTVQMPVLAATLNGSSVYGMQRFPAAALLIGNEGKGINGILINAATHKITIPSSGGAESLNAAVSTGILCALLKGG